MASQRCGEEDAEAILSNLKMEGRVLQQIRRSPCGLKDVPMLLFGTQPGS